ncbi:PDZ domain-containing protein [Nitriliruptoraceae bacterium ZYF776]|nr:PDZ domain-containing protein [Profundirhabdus halotolerans]
MSGGIAITVFVVSIIAAIMLHEAGHFLTAKAFGMRADRFFLGFGPTLWSFRRGETEYGVKALPLGGFVRIRGMSELDERLGPVAADVFDADALTEDRQRVAAAGGGDPLAVGNLPEPTWQRVTDELVDRGTRRDEAERLVAETRARLPEHPTADDAARVLTEVVDGEVPDSGRRGDLRHRLLRGDEGRFYADRPAWQRAIVLVAGSVMHFVIAIVVLFALFLTLPMLVATTTVEEVLPDSPAQAAGLQAGDRIVSIEGVASDDYDAITSVIRDNPGTALDVVVERDGATTPLTVTPMLAEDPQTGEQIGQVGFRPSAEEARLGPLESLEEAVVGELGFVSQVGQTFSAIGRVFGPEGLAAIVGQTTGEQERTADGAVSLVGAAGLAGQTSEFGIGLLLSLIASINVFIGVFNLLPLPPLDGGHLAVLGVERGVNAVRAARGLATDFTVDPRAIAAVAVPVLAVLGFVFFALLWLDITNPIRI